MIFNVGLCDMRCGLDRSVANFVTVIGSLLRLIFIDALTEPKWLLDNLYIFFYPKAKK